MIYYECYHISKSYNFNTKLNYIFHNMKHQALVTFVMVRVIVIAPITTNDLIVQEILLQNLKK
jgi:uncharacterized protein YbcC (UPF0753/DUF2309 family)